MLPHKVIVANVVSSPAKTKKPESDSGVILYSYSLVKTGNMSKVSTTNWYALTSRVVSTPVQKGDHVVKRNQPHRSLFNKRVSLSTAHYCFSSG